MLSILCGLTPLLLTKIPWGRNCYPHSTADLTDNEGEKKWLPKGLQGSIEIQIQQSEFFTWVLSLKKNAFP